MPARMSAGADIKLNLNVFMATWSFAAGSRSVRQGALRIAVVQRTDLVRGDGNNRRMKTLIACATLACVAATPVWQVAYAQVPVDATAANRHVSGLALEHRGDDRGAFIAFLDAAEGGYPPAQVKLGEIYDNGNAAVVRNYSESIRWYQKARENGEVIPAPKSPMPSVTLKP